MNGRVGLLLGMVVSWQLDTVLGKGFASFPWSYGPAHAVPASEREYLPQLIVCTNDFILIIFCTVRIEMSCGCLRYEKYATRDVHRLILVGWFPCAGPDRHHRRRPPMLTPLPLVPRLLRFSSPRELRPRGGPCRCRCG